LPLGSAAARSAAAEYPQSATVVSAVRSAQVFLHLIEHGSELTVVVLAVARISSDHDPCLLVDHGLGVVGEGLAVADLHEPRLWVRGLEI